MLKKLISAAKVDAFDVCCPGLFLTDTSNQGKGVFSTYDIEPKERLMKFCGDLLKLDQIEDFSHVLEIGDNLFLSPSGGIDDFVNHSCNPNCAILYENKQPILYSIKKIVAGEQLTFDYSLSIRHDRTSFDCSCESSRCRGLVSSFENLNQITKKKYLSKGLVPDWMTK